MTDSSKRLSTSEACNHLGCSDKTLRRYVKKGAIKKYGSHKQVYFNEHDVKKLYEQVHKNKAKHRPDSLEPTVKLTKTQEIHKAISKPTKALLNDHGTTVLLETTKLIEENGLLRGVERSTILRYSLAVQLKDQYMNTFMQDSDQFFLQCAKQFQSEIQHYEKELGLTPAALAKIKPMEKEEIDQESMEMEGMLNNG
jgi:excisionase family DNA binding protein